MKNINNFPGPKEPSYEAPSQGDHVFGDFSGVVRKIFKQNFGGRQDWLENVYKEKGAAFRKRWEALDDIDLGHHRLKKNPIAQREGFEESDRHSEVFGEQARGLEDKLKDMIEKGFTRARSRDLNKEIDNLYNVSVDKDALNRYLSKKSEARKASKKLEHEPISLRDASKTAEDSKSADKETINNIVKNYDRYRTGLNDIMKMFFFD